MFSRKDSFLSFSYVKSNQHNPKINNYFKSLYCPKIRRPFDEAGIELGDDEMCIGHKPLCVKEKLGFM
jgi:hypothetical protein